MTDQSVSRSENVVQVAGNVQLTNNYGLAVHEVRELAQIFMRENFPILREEAIAAANGNIQRFLDQFESMLAKKIEKIDPNRFKDPDIQSSLNDSVMEAAKKGDRSNSEILIDLVIERLSVGNDDYVSLVISEAIKVVPRLTPEQIGFLTLVLFLKATKIPTARSLDDIVPLASVVRQTSQDGFGLSDSKKSYLQFVGCASILQILSNSAYSIWKENYEFLKDIPENELIRKIETEFPVLHVLAKAFEENKIGQITLTPVGTVIGLANLSKMLPGVQYANWLN